MRPHLQRLIVPLTYPDPNEQFYGYDRRQLKTADRTIHPGIKDLALIVYGAAYSLTLLKANRYAGTGKKSEIALHYREQIGDRWTPLIEAIDQQCCKQWVYLIPTAPEQQQQLRILCEQTLGFENHFLSKYKAYLITHIQKADSFVQLKYVQQLERLIYYDHNILDILKLLQQSSNTELREAAARVLQSYQNQQMLE